MRKGWLAAGACVLTLPLGAQQASFVARLGRDTAFVEQFTRTATRLTGELVTRQGTPVLRVQYDIAIAADGYPTAMTSRVLTADGLPVPGRPTETRITFARDSVRRQVVWPDSTQVQIFAAPHAMAVLNPAYGPTELALAAFRKSGRDSVTFATVGGGGAPGRLTFLAGPSDTVRNPGAGGFVVVYRADRDGNLLSVDGNLTTSKILATRSNAPVSITALASKMAPLGVASVRGNAHGSFAPAGAVVFVDYGRPQVRDRTVWGGVLVPFDTIWRAGANEATHLATSRPLTFGDVVVAPGLYTLWIQHTRSATWLIISRRVGIWGTNYDSAQVLGRVKMDMAPAPAPVEEFTISIRTLAPTRGALDFAWGPSVATAAFTVSPR